MKIRKLNKFEDRPYNLLLSADPSQNSINDYVKRGLCFVAEEQQNIIGVFVLLLTLFIIKKRIDAIKHLLSFKRVY